MLVGIILFRGGFSLFSLLFFLLPVLWCVGGFGLHVRFVKGTQNIYEESCNLHLLCLQHTRVELSFSSKIIILVFMQNLMLTSLCGSIMRDHEFKSRLSENFLIFHITYDSCYMIMEAWLSGSELTIIRSFALVQQLSERKGLTSLLNQRRNYHYHYFVNNSYNLWKVY